MDIAQKVAQKIQQERIQPIARSYFVARHVFVWTAVAGTVTLTGVACGVMVYLLQGHEWGMPGVGDQSLPRQVLSSLPYFWLVLAIGLLSAAVVNSRWLKRGYSVRPSVYIGLYGVAALLLGVVIAETGRGELIEHSVARIVPSYDAMVNRPEEAWSQPERGLIAGELQSLADGGLILIDRRHMSYPLAVAGADWRCGASKQPGSIVKMVGAMDSDGTFVVNSVLPCDVSLRGASRCIRNRAFSSCQVFTKQPE